VKVIVAIRKMVDPRPHEVFGEEHWHMLLVYTAKCLLEHLETPVLALR
jgi:hypothetical protein